MTGTPWPGFGTNGVFLLPLANAAFADVTQPLALDDLHFAPKAEFHLTLLDRAMGAVVQARLHAHPDADARLRADFAALDWRVQRTGERWLLRHAGDADAAPRHSIVELLDAPAFAPFRAQVARATGVDLPAAPPHVTLYTAGDATGIGLPSDAAFAQRRVRRLA